VAASLCAENKICCSTAQLFATAAFQHFFDSQPHAKPRPLTLSLACSFSFTQLDSSMQNVDMQEFEYNPSKKDLTDAKIHHMLSEELCKPRRVSRVSKFNDPQMIKIRLQRFLSEFDPLGVGKVFFVSINLSRIWF